MKNLNKIGPLGRLLSISSLCMIALSFSTGCDNRPPFETDVNGPVDDRFETGRGGPSGLVRSNGKAATSSTVDARYDLGESVSDSSYADGMISRAYSEASNGVWRDMGQVVID